MYAARSAFFEAVKVAGPSREDTIARVTMVAKLLDNAFLIPGLNRRVGLDAVIGLAPGIGDVISAALAGYIVWEARRLGLPRRKIARMIGNIAFDTALGAIPVAGDLFDVFFKANQRNVRIIHDYLGLARRGPRHIDGTAARIDER
ncbi:DUF4112 domain-containing protein [Microvirga puerhi]|uniref:DUF4112 domain-containing protein n=1 Tax=Microvirga puerhi TaxID=2876078 RepID=A0ABS7VS36_9HYPH|nr:DUF4112 domain-containing protein [Microvirga puerhi]MBZ6078344.1 DUF4112 domain-containing protein [Microvirga puerhi]